MTKSFSAFSPRLKLQLFHSQVFSKCNRLHKTYKSSHQSLRERSTYLSALLFGRTSSLTKRYKSWAPNSHFSNNRTYRLALVGLVLPLTMHAGKTSWLEATTELPTWTVKTRTTTVALERLLKRITRLNDTTVRERGVFLQSVCSFTINRQARVPAFSVNSYSKLEEPTKRCIYSILKSAFLILQSLILKRLKCLKGGGRHFSF